MKQLNKKLLFLVPLAILFICILSGCIFKYKEQKEKELMEKINFYIEVEYGEKIDFRSFLKKDVTFESFFVKSDLKAIKEVGEYKIPIELDGYDFEITLVMKKTNILEFEVQDVTIFEDEEINVQDFIASINSASYKISPLNISKKVGTQTVTIEVIDEYGDVYQKNASLTVLKDSDAPRFSGLNAIETEIGKKVNLYLNVSAYDDRDGNVNFTVDDSKVNYSKTGWYTIFYSAADKAGNTVRKERSIHIKEKDITYQIDNFPTYNQFPNYPNGCESIALYTLLKYYKVNVTPEQIVNTLRMGEGPHYENGVLYGGNPEVEFVGDPRDARGYGVYEGPIIDVASKFKAGIINYSGSSFDSVLELVKNGIPVQVWASIDLKDTKVCVSWKEKNTGIKISWICDLHSMVITGFNSSTVYVSDPYHGSIKGYDRAQFERMYNLFGKRAIYYKE